MSKRFWLGLLATGFSQLTLALGTSFTYQGTLEEAGIPASGIYDFQFSLYDTAGTLLAPTIEQNDVAVDRGFFNAELDFGSTISTGDYLLSIAIRPGSSIGAYTTLNPRTPIRPTPQAQVAGVAAWALTVAPHSIGTGQILADQVQRRVSSTCPIDKSIRAIGEDGSVACADLIPGPAGPAGPPGSADAWSRVGNSGTSEINFLGTTDNQPLELRVNNTRVAKFNPAGSAADYGDAPSIVMGAPTNIASGIGSVVGGGGSTRNGTGVFDMSYGNVATGAFSVVAGGIRNLASGGNSTVSGGQNNEARGVASSTIGGNLNTGTGDFSSVLGGNSNTASGDNSVTVGGTGTRASGPISAVVGGNGNQASGSGSIVAGGYENTARGPFAAVLGGYQSSASSWYSASLGGRGNYSVGLNSLSMGGIENCAGGDYSSAAGSRAITRHGNEEGVDLACPGSSLTGIYSSGDADGDEGTFVWADRSSTSEPFISTGQNQFLVRAHGGFALNTNTPRPSSLLTIANSSGTVQMAVSETGQLFTTTGTISTLSDARLKKDIKPITGAMNLIGQLHPVWYRYTHGGEEPFQPAGKQMGFIAQEVQNVAPNWVSEDKSGTLSLNMRGFEALTVSALQELQAQLEISREILVKQNALIHKLVAQNKKLAKKLDALHRSREQ
jgi:hypothetical protein